MVTYFEHNEETTQYFFALGFFINSFAQIELHLKSVLFTISGCDNGTSQILFGNDRSDAAITKITQIIKTKGEIPPHLERSFQQLKLIAALRNILVHYGTHFGGDSFSADKSAFLPEAKHISKDVSAEVLTAMTNDLRTIKFSLVRVMANHTGLPDSGPWSQESEQPWQYKPPQPSHKAKSRPKSQKHPHPPESSQG